MASREKPWAREPEFMDCLPPRPEDGGHGARPGAYLKRNLSQLVISKSLITTCWADHGVCGHSAALGGVFGAKLVDTWMKLVYFTR